MVARRIAHHHEMLRALQQAKAALPPDTKITGKVLGRKAREFWAVGEHQYQVYIREGMKPEDRERLGLQPRRNGKFV